MLKLAVFDLDGTILRNTTAERELFHYLRSHGLIRQRQILQFCIRALGSLLQGSYHKVRVNKYYLYGLRVSDIEELLPQFCTSQLSQHFSAPVIKRLEELKQQGYRTVIVSGTLQPILRHLQSVLAVDEIIGSELEVKNGVITGHLKGIYPYGEGKVAALTNHFDERRVDYAASFAFANRYSDVLLLELFGHPVAVHPDPRLQRLAQQRNWEILE